MSAVAVAGPEEQTDASQPFRPPPVHVQAWTFVRRLLRQPLGAVCMVYLLVVIVACLSASLIAPYDPLAQDLLHTFAKPSAAHLLGTDMLGRDVLSRMLYGGRLTFLGVGEALLTALIIGVPVGLLAGYLGGWFDRIVNWITDIALSIPLLIIILLVLAVLSNSTTAAMVTFGVLVSPGLMRVVRSVTLAVREELYIAAARVTGLTRMQIVWRHILPRVLGVVIIQASLLAATALLVQAGLGYLGLGVQAPNPTWGSMVSDASTSIFQAEWLIIPSGAVIGLTVLAFGLLGDALRDTVAESWSPPRRARHQVRALSQPGHEDEPVPADALLALRHLTVAFPTAEGPVSVVQDVSFSVRPGETVGIVGESGCGKTVTALSILGGLKGALYVVSGEVNFGGRDLTGMSERELRVIRGRQIAYISQEPMSALDPLFKVGSQLAEAVRQHHGLSRGAAQKRVIELLRMVQLPNPEAVANRYPFELSGGMAQRVAIALALSGSPKLLIADEPTTALDVTVQAEILDLLRALQAETGMAVLLVTHDWGVVADICERALVMYAGQIVEQSELHSIFREPLHPYTLGLLGSNPHLAVEGEDLPTIPGSVPPPAEWPASCHFAPRCPFVTEACTQMPIPMEYPDSARGTRCIHWQELRAGAAEVAR